MLDRAVAALKENKEKALEMFNKGEGSFSDRDIVGKKGFPLGKEIMRTATGVGYYKE